MKKTVTLALIALSSMALADLQIFANTRAGSQGQGFYFCEVYKDGACLGRYAMSPTGFSQMKSPRIPLPRNSAYSAIVYFSNNGTGRLSYAFTETRYYSWWIVGDLKLTTNIPGI